MLTCNNSIDTAQRKIIQNNEEKLVKNKRKRTKNTGALAIQYMNQPSSESRRSPTNVTMCQIQPFPGLQGRAWHRFGHFPRPDAVIASLMAFHLG